MKKKLNKVMCKVLVGAMAVSMMPVAAMADDEVTLTYCTWNENQRDSIQATIDGFEAENPNIKVELQIIVSLFCSPAPVIPHGKAPRHRKMRYQMVTQRLQSR